MKKEILRIHNGGSVSDGVWELREIYLRLIKGETTGVSVFSSQDADCLRNILSGHENFSTGQIYFCEKIVKMTDIKHNIFVIDQTSQLLDELSIAENIFIIQGDLPAHTIIRQQKIEKKTQELFDTFEFRCNPKNKAAKVTVFERCVIEMLKAFIQKKIIVLFDLRGITLTSREQLELCTLINQLKKDLSFVFLDNNMIKLDSCIDNLVIINKGKTSFEINRFDIQKEQILESFKPLYEGRQMNHLPTYSQQKNKEVLKLANIFTQNISNFSLTCHCGELLTIIYRNDKVLQELLSILKGKTHQQSGKIYYNGKLYIPRDMCSSIKKGICFIEERAVKENLFYNMNVLENICIAKSARIGGFWRNKAYQRSLQTYIKRLLGEDIYNKPLRGCSMNDLQKISYYKWLFYKPNIIICVNPFSGIDISMREIAGNIINEYRKNNIAVIVLSSDTSNIPQNSSKIITI